MDWELAKLSDVCSPGNQKFSPIGNDSIPYVGLEHINSSGKLIGTGNSSEVTSLKTRFQSGSILFGKLRPYLRKIIKVSFDGVCSTDIMVIDPTQDVSADYMLYVLQSDAAVNHAVGTSGGTKMPRTSWPIFSKFTFPLPPISEQRRIAEILSAVDDAIERTGAIIEKLIQLNNGLMQRLFSRGISHSTFKRTKIGQIPDSWTILPLEDVASIERGKFQHRPRNEPRFYGGKYPFIQTGDVTNSGGRIRSYSQTLNEEGLAISRLFPAGTIIITIAANIGDTAIAEFDAAFPDSLIGITAGPEINNRFLEYYLRTRKDHLTGCATQSAQKNINLETLKPYPVPVPGKVEQLTIASILETVELDEQKEIGVSHRLKQLKSSLMQVLLTGKVRAKG
jgi:type I restriction enzyme S subunit